MQLHLNHAPVTDIFCHSGMRMYPAVDVLELGQTGASVFLHRQQQLINRAQIQHMADVVFTHLRLIVAIHPP